MRKTSIILLATSAALALSACSKKAPETLPPAPADTAPPPAPAPAPAQSGPTPGSRADFLATVSSDRVFFDTDKSDISDSEKATLQSQAAWLAKYPNVRVTIEGHCDERGTREYNLALGERRATSAKNFLASRGVVASRMTTIS